MKRYQHRDGFEPSTGPRRVLYAEVVSDTEVWAVFADGSRIQWRDAEVSNWVDIGWWVQIPIE